MLSCYGLAAVLYSTAPLLIMCPWRVHLEQGGGKGGEGGRSEGMEREGGREGPYLPKISA